MSPATSPNDPIFFLHHTQVTAWTQWQLQNPEVQTTELGGPKTQQNPLGVATLEDIMPCLDLVPDVKVSGVMSTQTSRLCYTY